MRNMARLIVLVFVTGLAPGSRAEPGKDWFQAAPSAGFSPRVQHTSVVFDNKIWVIGGVDTSPKNDVWSSPDGVTWTQETGAAAFPPRYKHTSVVFDNKMWVIGGAFPDGTTPNNDVWCSSNGRDWIQVTNTAGFAARMEHTSVVHDSKIWVLGGLGSPNDVWCSSDGLTWTEVNSASSYTERFLHQSVVFKNKLWVIGGGGGLNVFNDAWCSSDGIEWSQVAEGPRFAARMGHTTIVANDRIWVIGGLNGFIFGSAINDVWSSLDGKTWVEATASANFSPRESSSGVVFQNRIWIIGGSGLNDIWYSPLEATPTPTPTPTPIPTTPTPTPTPTPIPTVTPHVSLKINGQHPPNDYVLTPPSVRLTLDMNPNGITRPLDWYFGYAMNHEMYWISNNGVSTSPMSGTAPPMMLQDTQLLNLTLLPGTNATFFFLLADGSEIVALDYITMIATIGPF